MSRRWGWIVVAGAVGLGVSACTAGTTGLEPETALLSVAPAGGSTDVAVDEAVVVRFDHPMHDHAVDVAAVHEGDVTGPLVSGTWTLEENGTVMRFMPDEPWQAGTTYTVHLGGGMEDAGGHLVDFESHGPGMGGMWANEGMMGGGMHGGGMGGGDHPHMGEGWEHANGSYGMIFTFTTAG